MKFLKQRFNDISITRKLMLMSIGGIVMPLLLAVSAFTLNLYGLIEEREMIARNNAIDRIESNVYEFFDDLNASSTSFSADTELYRVINRVTPVSDYDAYTDFLTVTSRIRIIPWNIQEVSKVTLYHQREDFPEDELLSYLSEDVMNETWYRKYMENRSTFRFDAEEDDGKVWLISSSHFTTYSRAIDTILRQGVTAEEVSILLDDDYITGGSQIFLLDADNRVVATSDQNNVPTSLKVFDPSVLQKQEKILYRPYNFKTLTPGWQLVYYFDQAEIEAFVTERLMSFGLIMLSVFGFSFLVILFGAKIISERLVYISDVMHRFDGGRLIRAEEDGSSDEIGTVARSYNLLLDQLEEVLWDKSKAYEELEHSNEKLEQTNRKLAETNQELTASFEEIRVQDIRIQELIYSDLLTGLHNRFSITRIIEEGLYREDPGLDAIIFVDVDNFKYINDTYGHDIGDKVIEETGARLKAYESDVMAIARFGGDEFLIYAKDFSGMGHIIDTLESLSDAFSSPIELSDRRFYLTVSIGVAVAPDHGVDRNELIKKADMALYRSKEKGRNRYTFFDESFDQDMERRIVLQNAIKDAINEEEFYLNYQPYVDSQSGKLMGYEALIRWYSKDLGQVSPYELITTAEAMGSIVDIGDWILEEAMTFIRQINDDRKDKLSISINLSPVQLISKDFNDRLLKIAGAVGVSPQEVCLEMTETVLIDSFTRSSEDLKQLRNLGFQIALDDFGTGYSSLSYFKELPVSILKIDKSFIDEINVSEFNRQLVRVMTTIAHSKGITVTAEGVEHESQLRHLRDLSCDVIQGYLYSKPLSHEDAIEYLKKSGEGSHD